MADGHIGVWGHDFGDGDDDNGGDGSGLGHLFSPEGYHDLMSYCYPQWIGNYSFTKMLEFRLGDPGRAGIPASARAADRGTGRGDMLLLWGGVDAGELRLEPRLRVLDNRASSLVSGSVPPVGPRRGGRILFSLSFAPTSVAHGTGGENRVFAFAIPFDPAWDRDPRPHDAAGPRRLRDGGPLPG